MKKNHCPDCGKSGGLTKVAEFGKEKVPGSFCKKCGRFAPDKQSKTISLTCACGKDLGPLAHQVDVVVDGKIAHKGETPKKYFCVSCSKKRVEKGEHDVDEAMTRYPVNCIDCGTLLSYLDHSEGTEDVNTKIAYCDTCTVRIRELKSNENSIDGLVKDVSDPS